MLHVPSVNHVRVRSAIQGGLAGSESVDFREIAGSGSEMQTGLAVLLKALLKAGSERGSVPSTTAQPNPGSGSELFRASRAALH